MLVMVLGAGPAGLLAAEAAAGEGCDVVIVSAPGKDGMAQRSALHGCQYLHAPIPGVIGGPGVPVDYRLEGTADGYREKVYGPDYSGSVSPDQYAEEPHLAWDLRAAYGELWRRWWPMVLPRRLDVRTLTTTFEEYSPALVLSTVPAPALCIDMDNHGFSSEQIWATGQREDQASFPFRCPEFTVVCNGDPDYGWYRKANVFGRTTVEWPGKRKPAVEGVVLVSKPLKTDCECWLSSGHYVRIGRYGKWQKGYLAHEAYLDAKEAVRKFRAEGVQGTIWDPPLTDAEKMLRWRQG